MDKTSTFCGFVNFRGHECSWIVRNECPWIARNPQLQKLVDNDSPKCNFCNTCIFTYIKIWKFDSVIVSKTLIPIKICAQQMLMKPQYIHANDRCTIWCSKESHNKHLSFMKHMNHFLFSRYVCLQGQGLQPRNEMEGWLRLQLWVSRWHDRTICLHRNVSGYIASVDTLLND